MIHTKTARSQPNPIHIFRWSATKKTERPVKIKIIFSAKLYSSKTKQIYNKAAQLTLCSFVSCTLITLGNFIVNINIAAIGHRNSLAFIILRDISYICRNMSLCARLDSALFLTIDGNCN